MIETNGIFFNKTILHLGLSGAEKAVATTNAAKILEEIISAYEDSLGSGHVGIGGAGLPAGFSSSKAGPVGLIYGRIQSGKTRAMMLTSSMAFDNGFRIIIVLTSNINDLVTQTHSDFAKNLPEVNVFSKDDELSTQVEDAKLDLEDDSGRIVIVGAKGAKSLKNVAKFLKDIEGYLYPIIILDDEGDQASLDTNEYKRSSTGLTLQPSEINKLIARLRKDLPGSVFVSVTGTPQALLLQSASATMRPKFINMLPHGSEYVGGDYFFDTDEPENNEHSLISIVSSGEKIDLLNPKTPIPKGLKDSILYFLLSAAAAVKILGNQEKGYQYLCHPSLKNNEQDQAKIKIGSYLTAVKRVLQTKVDALDILSDLQTQYEALKSQLGDETPSFSDLQMVIRLELRKRKILVINASNQKRKGIEYGGGINFLIGGNTLGRGIAIPNLLVTYYVRSARKSQIDTMHQHARMFGYRNNTLKFTRLFITKNLYYRFRDINQSDRGLRNFIETHLDSLPNAFPVEYSEDLQATRKSVLNVNTTDVIWPGMQIYPNYMKLPQKQKVYESIMNDISSLFEIDDWTSDLVELQKKGKAGMIIKAKDATALVAAIKTNASNSWNDKTIATIIKKLAQRLGTDVKLKFRQAERTIGIGGFLAQGTISGKEQEEARSESMPTLWIMSVKGSPTSEESADHTFIFPTLIVPESLPQLFIFNKQ